MVDNTKELQGGRTVAECANLIRDDDECSQTFFAKDGSCTCLVRGWSCDEESSTQHEDSCCDSSFDFDICGPSGFVVLP